ncbi:MAG TPA: hypothetical protein DGH68_07475 [Bacteroidetes bacterium]|nr:hypothetical protein [Bacteroidota bacterium]
MAAVRVFSLAIALAFARPGVCQEYPHWFLFQGGIGCGKIAVGFVNPAFHADSAAALAVRCACENYVRQSAVKISGGQSFWATEAGTYWMGADFSEEYDTLSGSEVCAHLGVLDAVATAGGVFALVGSPECDVSSIRGKMISIVGNSPPGWIERLPSERGSHFAVGIAPQYFYEISSWVEAEQAARRNLARAVHTTMKSIQKQTTTEAQEVRHEELSVMLRDYQVVARWRDMKRQIFYVLLRMPIN